MKLTKKSLLAKMDEIDGIMNGNNDIYDLYINNDENKHLTTLIDLEIYINAMRRKQIKVIGKLIKSLDKK